MFLLFLYYVLLINTEMNKCASCKSYYEPIQKPNGKYYKSCERCLLKSTASRSQRQKKNIDNIDNIDNTIDNNDIDNTIDNNDIIDEYLNIIKMKNVIIEKLTTDNKNLNIIVNDYKTLLQQQPQQQQQQPQQNPNIKNDEKLEAMIKQLMMKK